MERARPVRKSHTNTSDLLTWSEAPPPATPPAAVRSRQPSDGISKVVFGGQVTDEQHQSLMRRKPKTKETTGSRIFASNANDATPESASSNPSRTSVRMVQKATNGISQISFSTEESVAPKKPTSIPEVAKQRELSGNLRRELDTKVKRHVSDAKCRELSGHDIFAQPPGNPPLSRAAARLLESKEKKNIDQPTPRNVHTSVKVSNPAGGQSNIMFSEETLVKTAGKMHNQKVQEMTGNIIFMGDARPRSAEKSVSQAKLQEMSGSNIFSDGGKVARKDYFGGDRKPPGGMVNTRNNRITLNSAPVDGTSDGSESLEPNHQNQQPQTPSPSIPFDAATVEALRNLILQTIQGAALAGSPNVTDPATGNQITNGGVETTHTLSDRSNFSRALKTFTIMRPDSYDGTGEPVRISYWFSHLEMLLENVDCTETDKVHLAALQLKGGASEWWQNSKLTKHPQLSWEMFKAKMQDRYFSSAMRDEKLNEFLYPDVKGLSIPEMATKFNHMLQYAGSEVSTEVQKIRRFHEWMSPNIKPWMVQSHFSTLEQYVDAAYKMEVTLGESALKMQGEKEPQPQGTHAGRFKRLASPQGSRWSKRSRSESSPSYPFKRSEQRKGPITCYNCGEQGHINKNCPKTRKKCFTYGKERHLHIYCSQHGKPAQSHQASTAHMNENSTKGKAPVASTSQGQQLYMMHQPGMPDNC